MMSQLSVAQGDRFDRINQLLRKYAALPLATQTGEALNEDAERNVLEQLQAVLGPLVQQHVNGRLPPIPVANRKDVLQEFWVLFINHIRRKRTEGQQAVQIECGSYVGWWVSYAAGSRGRRPCDQLNAAIHDYLSKPPDERDQHGTRVLLALQRCCEEVLNANQARGQAPIRTTEEVAQVLFGRLAEGTIWNVCIAPMYAQRAEDLESNDEDGGFQRWAHLHRYVDRGTFRAEAWPLLYGEPAPTPPIPPHSRSSHLLIPDEYRGWVKQKLQERFSELKPANLLQTFRRLSCLLFLGYYKTQSTFCDDFGIKDAYADGCKGFWLEHVAEDLAGIRRQVPQEEVLRFYKSHKHYGQFLDCLHDYWFIACTDCARTYLRENLAVGKEAFRVLWRYCFWEESLDRPAEVQFEPVNEEPPKPLDVFKEQDPPPHGLLVKVS